MKRRWWWLLLPLAIGGALGIVLSRSESYNPTLYLRADISVLVQICGVGWALLLAGWFFLRDYTEVERGKGKDAAKLLAAEDRRRFLGRLDHELKNPLTAIQVSLVNIKEKPDPQILESIQAQTQRLNQLVVDLRKLSDLETRPIECAPVNLTDILKTVAGITNESCSAKQIKLILNLPQAPWPLPPISGDSDLLLLAFHNLLDNSCKFSEPGDMIEVRAFEDGAMVVVEVADTGPGIPEDEVDHIWEELYRGQGARGIPGSGLGLSLVRVIIGRHNGQINLRSRTGEGTVATIRLPTVSQ